MAILLKRNAKVFISLVESGWTVDDTVRLNVLDDFSYSQFASANSATRSTIGPTGDRGLTSFVQETSPAEFSFTTYFSLFAGTLSSKLLWRALTNKTNVDASIDFMESNVAALPELFVYFEHGSTTYKISSSVITGASINMNLEGIPKITWSGTGKALTSSSSPFSFLDEYGLIPESMGKLTTVSLVRDAVTYNLALTSFSLDMDNGVSWVPRTRLGVQTLPDKYETGVRTISGDMQFYLKTGVNVSTDLMDNVLGDNLTGAEEKFTNITVNLGQEIAIDMPRVLLENTNLRTDEALTLSVPFIANQTSADTGDELTIELNALKTLANPNQTNLAQNVISTSVSMSIGQYASWVVNPASITPLQNVELIQGNNVNLEIYEEIDGVYVRVSRRARTKASSLFLGAFIAASATNVAVVVRANQATTAQIRAST